MHPRRGYSQDQKREWQNIERHAALSTYDDAKYKKAEKANKYNRTEYPGIYTLPGTLVLLRSRRTENFNGSEDRDYFTIEEGSHKVRISDNRGEIITTT